MAIPSCGPLRHFFCQQFFPQRSIGHHQRCPCSHPADGIDQEQPLEGGHVGEHKGHPKDPQAADKHGAEDRGHEGIPQPPEGADMISMMALKISSGSTQIIRVRASRATASSVV